VKFSYTKGQVKQKKWLANTALAKKEKSSFASVTINTDAIQEVCRDTEKQQEKQNFA